MKKNITINYVSVLCVLFIIFYDQNSHNWYDFHTVISAQAKNFREWHSHWVHIFPCLCQGPGRINDPSAVTPDFYPDSPMLRTWDLPGSRFRTCAYKPPSTLRKCLPISLPYFVIYYLYLTKLLQNCLQVKTRTVCRLKT